MELINIFETYLMEQGKTEKTIQSYTGDVAGFLSFISNKGIQFDGILNCLAIHSYKNHLLQETTNQTPSTKKSTIFNVSTYSSYHLEQENKW